MRRLLIPALTAALVLSACSEPETEVTEADIAAIEASLVNGSALAWELTQAETRVASMCMQDEGFTVHDTNRLHGSMIPNRFEGFESPYARIPTVEQAEKFGFGTWVWATDTEAALAMREDIDYLAFTAEDQGWSSGDADDSYAEWQAMDAEYQEAWTVAFVGEERAAYDAAMSEAFEEADTDAEIEDIDPGKQPPFGGCELQTIEIVYGEPVYSEFEDGEGYWSRPDTESPLTWIGDGDLYNELSADHATQEEDFLLCVDERGYGEWEFDDFGWLPTGSYLDQLYGGTEATEEVPPLTDEAEDAVDPVAYEFAMALDFAECADDAGLHEGTDEAWARMSVAKVIDRESEVYAWEKEIEEYLSNAQDYLAGQ